MFSIRDIRPGDLPEVHAFTVKLLQHHIGQQSQSYLTECELSGLFYSGFLKGLLLIRSPIAEQNSNLALIPEEDETKAVGFMIFHADISLLRGGHGVCLDQFYIEPEYRRLGLGRRMMAALCKHVLSIEGNYIKILYQDGLGLDAVYGKMGFVNHSKGDAGVHLFEAYGEAKLQEFMTHAQETSSASFERSHVLITPFTERATDPGGQLPAWSSLELAGPINTGNAKLPGARLVIVAEAGPCVVASESISNTGLLSRFHSRLCMFIEQTCVCCWLGPMVNFADFVGDTSILKPSLFLNRVQDWIQYSPRIRGAVWEVPTEPCRSKLDEQDSGVGSNFATRLKDLDVPDYTGCEGWNIAYLDVAGMRNLVDTCTALEISY